MSTSHQNAPITSSTTATAAATPFATATDAIVTRSTAPPPCQTSASASALIISATNKAGMCHIDRQLIDSILLRESGDSPYMKRQRKLDDNTNLRVRSIRSKLRQKNERDARWKQRLIDGALTPLLNSHIAKATVQQPISTVAVIDMDSFFISCHILTQPRLSSIPACVGGPSMISTSNYPARKFGVRAAMPGYIGRILVRELSGGKEDLVFVKSDYELYERKSGEVRGVLEEYDPGLRMGGLDEGVLNLEPYLELLLGGVGVGEGLGNEHGSGEGGIMNWSEARHELIRDILWQRRGKRSDATTISAAEADVNTTKITTATRGSARQHPLSKFPPSIIHKAAQTLLQTIRCKVHAITGLTCSAGLASNPLLAKIASDVHKPNGQYFVGPSQREIRQFLHPMPIRKVGGIGRVMEKLLREGIGVETVGDLYEKKAEVWTSFGQKTGEFLMRVCVGFRERGGRDIASGGAVGATNGDGDLDWEEDEVTQKQQQHQQQRKGISHERTFTPTSSWSELCTKLEAITYSLVKDMMERDLKPKTITVNIKLANFEVLSKATTREVAFFSHGFNSVESRDLVDVVVKLLKEAKRAYREKSMKSENTLLIKLINSRAKQNSFNDGNNKSGGDTFSVRLLGVRCSNFQFDKDNQSLLNRFCKAEKDKPTSTNANSKAHSCQPDGVPSKLQDSYSISNSRSTTPIRINPYASPKSTLSRDKSPRKDTDTPSSRRNLYSSAIDHLSNSTISPSLEQSPKTHVTGSIVVATEPSKNERIQCPVCNESFRIHSGENYHRNAEINSHIDSCLSSSTVKQLAKEETMLCARSKQRQENGDGGHSTNRKRRKLTEFFGLR